VIFLVWPGPFVLSMYSLGAAEQSTDCLDVAPPLSYAMFPFPEVMPLSVLKNPFPAVSRPVVESPRVGGLTALRRLLRSRPAFVPLGGLLVSTG
jgi:hypothetical protein